MSGWTRSDIVGTLAQGGLAGLALGGISPAQALGAATPPGRLAGVVALNDAGTVGDGKADDTAAINRALKQAAALPNGAIVYAPPGIYRTLGGHVISPRLQLVGSGVGATTFRHLGPGSCFTLTAPGVTEQRIGIADLSIVGSDSSGATAVEFRDVSFGAWARLVRVRDYRDGIAFLVQNVAPGQYSEGVTLLGCSSSNNARGVVFRRQNGTNSFKGFYAEQFACNIPAHGTGFDFGVDGTSQIIVYNAYFHGHIWFNKHEGNIGWDVGQKAILRDGQAWMSGEGSSPTSLSMRNRAGGTVALFGQWWFGQIPHEVDPRRTRIGPVTSGSLHA